MDAGRATGASISTTHGDRQPSMRCDFLEGHRPERLDRQAGTGSQDGLLPFPEPPFESLHILGAQAAVLRRQMSNLFAMEVIRRRKETKILARLQQNR